MERKNEASDRASRNIANRGQQDEDPQKKEDRALVRNLTSRGGTRKLKLLGVGSKYHSKEERY